MSGLINTSEEIGDVRLAQSLYKDGRFGNMFLNGIRIIPPITEKYRNLYTNTKILNPDNFYKNEYTDNLEIVGPDENGFYSFSPITYPYTPTQRIPFMQIVPLTVGRMYTLSFELDLTDFFLSQPDPNYSPALSISSAGSDWEYFRIGVDGKLNNRGSSQLWLDKMYESRSNILVEIIFKAQNASTDVYRAPMFDIWYNYNPEYRPDMRYGPYRIKKFQLEKGRRATPWSPNNENEPQ